MRKRRVHPTPNRWFAAGLTAALCIAILVVAFLLLGSTRPARAPAASLSRPPAPALGQFYENSFMQLSTVHADRGVSLQLLVSCGTDSSLDADYTQARGSAVLSNQYQGPAGCRFTRDLDSGRLVAHWGRSFALVLTATLHGAPTVQHARGAAGCAATRTTRTYRISGTLTARIHAAAFGSFVTDPARLTVQTIAVLHCATQSDGSGASESEFFFAGPRTRRPAKTVARTAGDELTGFNGATQLDAAQDVRGGVTLTALAPDGPAPGVDDQIALRLPSRTFSPQTSNLRTARIDAGSPFSRGVLTYLAGAGCSRSADATQGILRGAIQIIDPEVTHLTITGADIGQTELDGPHARSEDCAPLTG